MPAVKKTYTKAEAQAAVDRSNGQRLSDGSGSPENRRTYNNTGKKLGHEYMHRGSINIYNSSGDHPSGLRTDMSTLEKNMYKKSRTENRRTSYELTMHLLNSSAGQTALGELDALGDNPSTTQKWLKNIPVGADLYGYEGSSGVAKKITKAAINFRKIHGALFVASVYPTEFAGERDYSDAFEALFG